jgi:hypothetical protein
VILAMQNVKDFLEQLKKSIFEEEIESRFIAMLALKRI